MCAVSLVEEYAPDGQFCTNHGKCVKLVTGSDPHPGCVCREGWKGERCELKSSESSIPKLMGSEGGGSTAGRWVLFSMLVIVMLAVATAVIINLIKIKRGKTGLSKERAVGKTPVEVGVGDLEPDGSGTLGQDSEAKPEEGEGDLEMKESSTAAPGDDNDGAMSTEDRSDSRGDEIAIGERNGRFALEFT